MTYKEYKEWKTKSTEPKKPKRKYKPRRKFPREMWICDNKGTKMWKDIVVGKINGEYLTPFVSEKIKQQRNTYMAWKYVKEID
jgi:hypothetical protein